MIKGFCPLVSVVTVCKNSAATISRTLDSIRTQSYPFVEYVVIDGDSTDETVDILEKNKDLLDYFESKPDNGIYHAMNRGIEVSDGEYIIFLNSDDSYVPQAIERLVDALYYSGADFVSALATYEYADGGRKKLRSMPFDEAVRLRMPLRHETMLISREIYRQLGLYDESYQIIGDLDFARRLFENQKTHYELPNPLLNFKTTGISNSSPERLVNERRVFLSRQFPDLEVQDLKLLSQTKNLTSENISRLVEKYAENETLHRSLRAYANYKVNDGSDHEVLRYSSLAAGYFISPKVSVILVIYNVLEFLPNVLGDLLSQTLNDIELIVIDDRSTDGSYELLEAYAKRDRCIRLHRNKNNSGLGSSRNHGVCIAKGNYIFHVDPDDRIPVDALKRLYDCAISSSAEMVKGSYWREQAQYGKDGLGRSLVSLNPESQPRVGCDLKNFPVLLHTTEGHWSYLYQADFARRTPYPTDLTMGQDSLFIVRALATTRSVSIISDLVYVYTKNIMSSMNNFTVQKYRDAITWRTRAWWILKEHGHHHLAKYILIDYWSEEYFKSLLSGYESSVVADTLGSLATFMREKGINSSYSGSSELIKLFYDCIYNGCTLEETVVTLKKWNDSLVSG